MLKNYQDLKLIKQKTIGYCGPASIQIILSVNNVDLQQEKIMDFLCIPDEKQSEGTRIDQLAKSIKSLTTDYILLGKYNSSVKDLYLLSHEYKIPVGIEWQGSFSRPNGHVYDEGHYSVILDTDLAKRRFSLLDPDERSTYQDGLLSFDQLEKKWWDINKIPYKQNGKIVMIECYNEKLAFVVVPRIKIVFFEEMGFRLPTIKLIRKNQKPCKR